MLSREEIIEKSSPEAFRSWLESLPPNHSVTWEDGEYTCHCPIAEFLRTIDPTICRFSGRRYTRTLDIPRSDWVPMPEWMSDFANNFDNRRYTFGKSYHWTPADALAALDQVPTHLFKEHS